MISCGRTLDVSCRGRGLFDRKLLFAVGVVDGDDNSLRYVDTLLCVSSGLLCGVLYSAMMNRPRLNISQLVLSVASSTASGAA